MPTPRNRIIRFGAAITVIILTLSYLAYTGVEASKSYYVTISELKANKDDAHSKRLRVAGTVVKGSIKRMGTVVEFDIEENGLTQHVIYKGTEAPADTFKDGTQALVEGKLDSQNVFRATMLQAKCASRYAPAPNGQQPTAGTMPTKS